MCKFDAMREKYKNELVSILEENVYIYGAGIVGKRLIGVIEKLSCKSKIRGILVTDVTKMEINTLEGIEIISVNSLKNKESKILVAVSDLYQNEIFFTLTDLGFKNIINGYIYSFLFENVIPEDIPLEVPYEVEVNTSEIMSMQFQKGQFIKYDILLEIIRKNEIRDENKSQKFVYVDKEFHIYGCIDEIVYALQIGKEQVTVVQQFSVNAERKDLDWLKKNATDEEIAYVEKKLIYFKNIWIRPFIGILWPPAEIVFSQLIDEMKRTVVIKNVYDLRLDKRDVQGFVNSIYKSDDTEEWQIKVKIERILKEMTYTFRIVEYFVENPDFKIKRYGHSISTYGVCMKRKLREKYKRMIPNYVHDVIIHTSDNYDQTDKILRVLEEYK